MNLPASNTHMDTERAEFKRYAAIRLLIGLLMIVAILWLFSIILGRFTGPEAPAPAPASPVHSGTAAEKTAAPVPTAHEADAPPAAATSHAPAPAAALPAKTGSAHLPATGGNVGQIRGIAFVEAIIRPLAYELDQRAWGWRPNDVVNLTDNINNFQLGVLEVTRRTAVNLAERISRTGSTAAFDRNLENAMNWFMVKADRYWFPSPESKYRDGLAELKVYREKLKRKEATFYTRPDNLIPLLAAFEDLLGSCDENLVKVEEEGGLPVSFFKADDYFYYAQGVAGAMGTILDAVLEDFQATLESRHGTELLHHAIASCRRAVEIKPWIVTEGSLSGVLANHRANMAAPISHARFFIGVLITTLST